MLILRLKQCERALADGRLEEAFDLVRRADVRAHRRGQELVNEVVKAFVDRGRHHLGQGRLTAAAGDADRAIQLGGNGNDAVQLRAAVGAAQHGQAKVNQQAAQAVALARRHADLGQLSVGQALLAESPVKDSRVDGLKNDLAARRAGLESALKKASEAFDAGDWEAAVDHLAMVGKSAAQDAGVRRLANRIADYVADLAKPLVKSGRLDAVAGLVERLDRIRADTTALAQIRMTLEQCQAACKAIAEGGQREAEEALKRLEVMWPGTKWVGDLVEQSRKWGEAESAIRTSPLSLLVMRAERGLALTRLPGVAMEKPVAKSNDVGSFILHVDGIGSFQIFSGSKVSIGPLSSTRGLDLPLMIDASAPTVTLSRSDGDYFLNADKPATVNEAQCVSRLLNSGDRIGLGTRCRLMFRRPSAASGTAVLDVSGARLPSAGIRQVILMDREIVIGLGGGAHIRVDELAAPVVLMRSGEGLVCRSGGEIMIDGRPAGGSANLPVGASVSVGSLRFVISREQRP